MSMEEFDLEQFEEFRDLKQQRDDLLAVCEQILNERPLPGFLTRKLQKALAKAKEE